MKRLTLFLISTLFLSCCVSSNKNLPISKKPLAGKSYIFGNFLIGDRNYHNIVLNMIRVNEESNIKEFAFSKQSGFYMIEVEPGKYKFTNIRELENKGKAYEERKEILYHNYDYIIVNANQISKVYRKPFIVEPNKVYYIGHWALNQEFDKEHSNTGWWRWAFKYSMKDDLEPIKLDFKKHYKYFNDMKIERIFE